MTLPTITPPPAAPSRNNPVTFPAAADAMMAYFAPFVDGLNDLVSGLNTLSAQLLAAAEAADASASDASTAQTGASSAASTAGAAAAAAAAARDATLAAYDSFDDRYLGAKSAPPVVDNDGAPLVAGSLYFDSTSEKMMLWTGSAWVAAYVSAEGLLVAASNLADLTNAATARANLGLGDLATLDALDFYKSDATWISGADSGQATISPAQLAATIGPRGMAEPQALAGSSVIFSGIPVGANHVEVTLVGASLSSSGLISLRLGTSGGIVSTGYSAAASQNGNSGATSASSSSTDIPVSGQTSTSASITGTMVLNRVSGNIWAGSGFFVDSVAPRGGGGGGYVDIGGDISQIAIIAGAGSFDAGTAIIAWK